VIDCVFFFCPARDPNTEGALNKLLDLLCCDGCGNWIPRNQRGERFREVHIVLRAIPGGFIFPCWLLNGINLGFLISAG
jgi:hypothetical protein